MYSSVDIVRVKVRVIVRVTVRVRDILVRVKDSTCRSINQSIY
jgi:hypothetical protein